MWMAFLQPIVTGLGHVDAAEPAEARAQKNSVVPRWARSLPQTKNVFRGGQMLRGLQAQLGLLPAASAPPVGGVYSRTIWLPVLGKQKISLTVLASNLLRLQLSGAISLDDTVSYISTPAGLAFEFSPPTIRMLQRFRTSFRGADYIADTDHAIFRVSPPLVGTVHVQLLRQ